MKKTTLIFVILLQVMMASAQQPRNHRHFDPQQFQVKMEQFITQEAMLSPTEAEDFFPLFREMHKQQRLLFDESIRMAHIKPVDEEGCRKAVMKRDELEIRAKELQRDYHRKMLKVISASKLYDVMKAERKFHRQAFKKRVERK